MNEARDRLVALPEPTDKQLDQWVVRACELWDDPDEMRALFELAYGVGVRVIYKAVAERLERGAQAKARLAAVDRDDAAVAIAKILNAWDRQSTVSGVIAYRILDALAAIQAAPCRRLHHLVACPACAALTKPDDGSDR